MSRNPTCKIDPSALNHIIHSPSLKYHSSKPVTRAIHKIWHIISKSRVPEDPLHAINTLQLLLRLRPDAPLPVRIAAFGHDIERSFPYPVKTRKERFSDYNAFKQAHADNSARILQAILLKCRVDEKVAHRVHDLVRAHEFGGDQWSDVLKDADSLSFFCVNLPLYMQREGPETVGKRIAWGIERLSPRALDLLKQWCKRGEPDLGDYNKANWPAKPVLEQLDQLI